MTWRGSRRHDRATPEGEGSTLIEVLVASVIMGSSVILLVTGMSTLFSSSVLNRQATTASVVARDYAEALVLTVAQTGAWCSSTYAVSFAPPSGYTVSAAYGACPVNDATTPQFQTVTISAVPPTGATEQLRMVVRQT
jgi:type II secretory pathway pseudopilin PulG